MTASSTLSHSSQLSHFISFTPDFQGNEQTEAANTNEHTAFSVKHCAS